MDRSTDEQKKHKCDFKNTQTNGKIDRIMNNAK